ncbi:MAG: hypothetical protein HY717_00395 [Planctomycetes bacterium]|nr:hypothetical protein [Planctomycetota bacterium]
MPSPFTLIVQQWIVFPLFLSLAATPPAVGLPSAGGEEKPAEEKKSPEENREARRSLLKAVQSDDPKSIQHAVKDLIRSGGKRNIAMLLEILPQIPATKDATYWSLVEGACSFTDGEALEELGECIVRNARNGFARDLLYGLSENPSKKVALALAPVLRKGPEDLKFFAIQKIGEVRTAEAVDVLIEILKAEEKKTAKPEDSDLVLEIVAALQRLTGQPMGPNSINWEGWWKQNRAAAKLRKRGGGEGEEKSTGTAVDTVHLDRKRKREFFGLEKAPKKGVVVLSAEYEKPIERDLNNDHIERVLSRMGVPHEVVKRSDFEKYDLSKTGALVINCAQFHEFCICPTCKPSGSPTNRLYRCSDCNVHKTFSATLSGAALKKIKSFVSRGGYLFCEDWTVKEVLEQLYSKYVATGAVLRKADTPNVDVVPGRGRSTHPYLKGIFIPLDRDEDEDEGEGEDEDGDEKGEGGKTSPVDEKGKPVKKNKDAEIVKLKFRWTIDDESWTFDLKDAQRVLVLMSSGELQDKTGQGVVAFAFRPGGSPEGIGKPIKKGQRRPGVVLQVLSHFGKQGSSRDELLLQNLLLNFLIDANVEREKWAGKEKEGETTKKDPEPDDGGEIGGRDDGGDGKGG